MFLKLLEIKRCVKKAITTVIKSFFPVGSVYNAPRKVINSFDWLLKKGKSAGKIITILKTVAREEQAPEIFNYKISNRFRKYFQRNIPAAYVVELYNGKVYGNETNFIITPDNLLLEDLSREFGMYGGRPMQLSSLIRQRLRLPKCVSIKGRVAVISTSGCSNFHHWNYDILPRLYILKQAEIINSIDYFIISWSKTPYQKESLNLLNIDENKIINPLKTNCSFYMADTLVIPSLPSMLGTVSPWVVDFLRNTYNPWGQKKQIFSKVYLSRKNVATRKIVNNEAFSKLLKQYSIVEIFPEDYPVSELAQILAGVSLIISVHGSGLSNICFISEKTTIIDILAPYHQDGYYWMISNIRNSKYIGFFGEGEHPSDDIDLVKNKIDNDIYLDLNKMQELLSRENVYENI